MPRLALAGLLACACAAYPPHRSASAWELQGDVIPGAARALELTYQHAPRQLPWWGGVLEYVPAAALEPDAGLVAWWPDDVPRAYVAAEAGQAASETATAHEAQHVAQLVCGLEPEHDQGFDERVGLVNDELRAEGL